jgi:hypothetical protein
MKEKHLDVLEREAEKEAIDQLKEVREGRAAKPFTSKRAKELFEEMSVLVRPHNQYVTQRLVPSQNTTETNRIDTEEQDKYKTQPLQPLEFKAAPNEESIDEGDDHLKTKKIA